MIALLDVAELCARMRATSLDLFERLGAWVFDAPAGAEQQRWAVACHRHAWHAELWAQRAPAIRPFDLESAVAAHRGLAPADGDRAAWYAGELTRLIGDLDAAAARVDAELDPNTARTITLVRADLAELAS